MVFRRKTEGNTDTAEGTWGDDDQSTSVQTMPFLAHGTQAPAAEDPAGEPDVDGVGDESEEEAITLADFLSGPDDPATTEPSSLPALSPPPPPVEAPPPAEASLADMTLADFLDGDDASPSPETVDEDEVAQPVEPLPAAPDGEAPAVSTASSPKPRRNAKRAPSEDASLSAPSLPEAQDDHDGAQTVPFTIRLRQEEMQRLIGYAVSHGEPSVAECARRLVLSTIADTDDPTPDDLLVRIRSDLSSLEDAFAKGKGLEAPKIVRVIVSSE